MKQGGEGVEAARERAGLSAAQCAAIERRLGRAPNRVELAMFGVMWSEHCSYAHSRQLLKRLPSRAPQVLEGPGHNAGVVEVAPGLAAAFKIESHNHPSAVDPFHGAATGVGGILRDVLSMGARPIAFVDALRFGPPAEARTRFLREGVVRGIAHYGNACGVPTLAGEIDHAPCYRHNPIVNVGCVGLVATDRVMSAAARGPGNRVVYAGAPTGRDGMGGARFASDALGPERTDAERAAVQIGDPFAGKLLIEATLEALASGWVVALQDMGAAGLCGASAEMAAAGGLGMALVLERVPLREPNMTPIEILLSESQERMLLIVEPEGVAHVARIYRRWGLVAEPIGTLIGRPRLEISAHGALVADLPPALLTEAPACPIEPVEPPERRALRVRAIAPPRARGRDAAALLERAALALLRSPGIASKRAVYERFDHMVQLRTVLAPGTADAAVLRLEQRPPRGIALSVDRHAYLDPRTGGMGAVCEAALNLACAGARPLAVTDGLNLGDPQRPAGAWELAGVIDGIAAACTALGLPVTGGNVSLYNETGGEAVWPTPLVFALGVLEDVARARPFAFPAPERALFLIGARPCSLGASAWLACVRDEVAGAPLEPDLQLHAALLEWLVDQAPRCGVEAAHDVSDGGLFVALAESAVAGGCGARVELALAPNEDPVTALFGEGPSRVLVCCPEDAAAALARSCAQAGLGCTRLGRTGGERLEVVLGGKPARDGGGVQLALSLERLRAAWEPLT